MHLWFCKWFLRRFSFVEFDGKKFFIDKNGNEVINCNYDDIGDFSEGLARVKLGGKWGYINKNGDMVIDCIYDYADYYYGLVCVKHDKKYGFIDKNGNEITKCIFDDARYHSEGLARVKIDGKYGFINNSGTEVQLTNLNNQQKCGKMWDELRSDVPCKDAKVPGEPYPQGNLRGVRGERKYRAEMAEAAPRDGGP